MRPRIASSRYPLCETCGTRCRYRNGRFCSHACIPKSARQQWCKKGRKTYAYRRRAIMLKRYLDRLSGKRVTREELCEVLWEFGKVRYNVGFQVAKHGGSLQDAKDRDAA